MSPLTSDLLLDHCSEQRIKAQKILNNQLIDPPSKHGGRDYARKYSYIIDQFLTDLWIDVWKQTCEVSKNDDTLTLVAVGGYGRRELCPHSDIDLVFIQPTKNNPEMVASGNEAIKRFIYRVWDTGLKPGYSVRSIDQCIKDAKTDWIWRTNMLDGRRLAGATRVFADWRRRLRLQLLRGQEAGFVRAKLAEMDERHRAFGDSRAMLEPNIKESKGALRDIHTILWMAQCVWAIRRTHALGKRDILTADEVQRMIEIHDFFLTIRCHLHIIAGRSEEYLTFDMQRLIARAMGYDAVTDTAAEDLMHDYFLAARAVGSIMRAVRSMCEGRQRWPQRLHSLKQRLQRRPLPPDIVIRGTCLALEDPFSAPPRLWLAMFIAGQHYGMDIDRRTLRDGQRMLRQDDCQRRWTQAVDDRATMDLFWTILTGLDAYAILSLMNDTGFLSTIIPEFSAIVGRMQYGIYHSYTVDAHSLRVVRYVQSIQRGEKLEQHPLASAAVGKISTDGRALYLAALLHDVAKGQDGDHSNNGAVIAAKVARRLGLSSAEAQTAAWLVRHHLLMSKTAFRRDIHDPQTMREFIGHVVSIERLRLLMILTVADICAVSSTTWNSWKKTLLTQLYIAARDILTGRSGLAAADNVKEAIKRWREQAQGRLTPSEQEQFIALVKKRYWMTESIADQLRQARLVMDFSDDGDQPFAMECLVLKARAINQITLCGHHHHRFLAVGAGAIACAGGDIVEARSHVLNNGRNISVFAVQNQPNWLHQEQLQAFADPVKINHLRQLLTQALQDKINLAHHIARRPPILPKRIIDLAPDPQIHIYDDLSRTANVFEVIGPNRPGLLFAIVRVMAENGLHIASAQIYSYGTKVVDTFYVRDAFGLKISSDHKKASVRQALMIALTHPLHVPDVADMTTMVKA